MTQDIFVEFSEYLLSRKRMSDLEAALNFISSLDMNVRDEKNVLVPVSTLVDRVLDTLAVKVTTYTGEWATPREWGDPCQMSSDLPPGPSGSRRSS